LTDYNMSLVGYARVSTEDQNLDHQIASLKKAGVHPRLIVKEKRSGKNTDRPELQRLLADLEPGQVVVVTHFDRLARDLLDLLTLSKEIERKGAGLRVIEQEIDTTTATGMLYFHMIGAFAQFQRNIQAEKQAKGIAEAKKKGVYKGGVKKVTADAVLPLMEAGFGPTQIAEKLGVTRQTIYNVRKTMRQ
jgi:DNA invertase Pin-like site-specific DNA recombinase